MKRVSRKKYESKERSVHEKIKKKERRKRLQRK